MNEQSLKDILNYFNVPKGEVNYVELKSGLINNTYKIDFIVTGKALILQKINTNIFPEYQMLMKNLINVSRHINNNIQVIKLNSYLNPQFYSTLKGKSYLKLNNGSIWRLSDYIENNKPDQNDLKNIAKESGKILAYFHLMTNNLPIKEIHETIPNFHNIQLRWERFITISKTESQRLRKTRSVFKKILSFKYLVNEFNEIINTGLLPLRTVHNDPKISNILFYNNKAISLIDFDTIMPGFIPIDFGDAIRSLCNIANENEIDLNKVSFNFDSFKIYSKSYFSIMSNQLNDKEKSSLSIFSLIITLEQAIRFYTDYLEGDIYYKIDNPHQNLTRARGQLKLLEEMWFYYDKMEDYISKLTY